MIDQVAPKTLWNLLLSTLPSCTVHSAKTPLGKTMHHQVAQNRGSHLARRAMTKIEMVIQAKAIHHRTKARQRHTEYMTSPKSSFCGNPSPRLIGSSCDRLWPLMSTENPPWPRGVKVLSVANTAVASGAPWRSKRSRYALDIIVANERPMIPMLSANVVDTSAKVCECGVNAALNTPPQVDSVTRATTGRIHIGRTCERDCGFRPMRE